MNTFRQKRAWFWVAIAAVVVILIALLVPHGHGADQPAWLEMLPVFFIGLIAPLNLLRPISVLSLGRKPNSPSTAPSFQRPPPPRFA